MADGRVGRLRCFWLKQQDCDGTHRDQDQLKKAGIERFKHKFIKGYFDTIKYLKPDLWTEEDKRDFQIHFGAEIIARTAGIFQKGYLYDGLPPKHPVIREALEEAKDWITGEKYMMNNWF